MGLNINLQKTQCVHREDEDEDINPQQSELGKCEKYNWKYNINRRNISKEYEIKSSSRSKVCVYILNSHLRYLFILLINEQVSKFLIPSRSLNW